jgi:hypothetical protein
MYPGDIHRFFLYGVSISKSERNFYTFLAFFYTFFAGKKADRWIDKEK